MYDQKTKQVIGCFDRKPISSDFQKLMCQRQGELRRNQTEAEKLFEVGVAQVISDEAQTPFVGQRLFYLADGIAFVADVYFKKFRLAVEIDGPSHYGKRSRAWDGWRSDVLERYAGVLVIRFTNKEVLTDLNAVFGKVVRAMGNREEATPSHRKYLRRVYGHYF